MKANADATLAILAYISVESVVVTVRWALTVWMDLGFTPKGDSDNRPDPPCGVLGIHNIDGHVLGSTVTSGEDGPDLEARNPHTIPFCSPSQPPPK